MCNKVYLQSTEFPCWSNTYLKDRGKLNTDKCNSQASSLVESAEFKRKIIASIDKQK